MLIDQPLPFIKDFLNQLNDSIKAQNSRQSLSLTQRAWLGFCLMGILITNSICWAKFERASFGSYPRAALSWMFKHAKIPWEKLLTASVRLILKKYGILEGMLVIDDSDKKRRKSANKIYQVQKFSEKTSGGYINGQEFIVLLLVTAQITIPVGFAFYQPDPVYSKWKKPDKKLKQKKVPQKNRPVAPPKNKNYPTKLEIALNFFEDFKHCHPTFKVKVILADALYGTANFLDKAAATFGGIQVISDVATKIFVTRVKPKVLKSFLATILASHKICLFEAEHNAQNTS